MLCTRKRKRSDYQTPNDTKCTKSRMDQRDEDCLAASCGNARLTVEIVALTNALADIKMFLMMPEEAVVEAAGSSRTVWLDQLLARHECRVPSALVIAATHGHLGCVAMLLKKYFDHVRENLTEDDWELVREATRAAGGKGHLCVLKRLMPVLFTPGVPGISYLARPAAFKSLDVAAVNGHLDVVRYIVPHVKNNKYVHGTMAAGILAHAISARHMDVVE
ncbi:hypothetical protein PI124_g14166 [Phytophthora idaei]|nr:hypothetical protein PI125_g12859 [Phytophthora idaei]KAG3149623.1 hypothetical protein PI126_g11924 [Phytophthora idaei]KAG3240940.1 hypothetical protein PI124_g14166 [Phytophthora idaei]